MASIKNHPITFEAFLKLGGNLQETSSGYLVNFEYAGSLCSYPMSSKDFTAVDERLPKVIEAMFAHEAKFRYDKSTSRVYVQTILSTLRHWENPVYVHLNSNYSFYINKIRDIIKYPNSNGQITLEAECCRYINKVADIEYVTTTVLNTIDLPLEELDKFYPGWRTRYEVLAQLGYAKSELINQVFQKPTPGASLPMDNVSFD